MIENVPEKRTGPFEGARPVQRREHCSSPAAPRQRRGMLVLTRREGEAVVLSLHGRKIGVVSVVESNRGRLRLGFVMAPEIEVRRSELGGEA